MIFKFQLRLAIRSLIAQKKFSLISILSLSLAFASVLIIALWLVQELSYDRHFPKQDRIQRLTLQINTPDGYQSHFARVAQGWVQQVGEHIPEIEQTVRLAPMRNALVSIGKNRFATTRAFATDTTVFEVFDINLSQGNKSSCLRDPHCVIISEKVAERYFYGKSPIGEYLNLFGQKQEVGQKYLITGVFKDFPEVSHFHPELLLSFEDPTQYGWAYFYLLLHKNTSLSTLQSKLDDYVVSRVDSTEVNNNSLHLQKLTDIHLHSHKDRELELNGNSQSVYIMGAIALMILLIALINYINLNIAQLFKEIRFLIINKIYGASGKSILQFQLIKSTLFAFLSSMFALVFFKMAESSLGTIFNIGLLPPSGFYMISGLVLSALFLLAILAGSLPAFQFILSRFNQKMVTRSSNLVRLFHPQKKFMLRKVLIGMQFGISLALIIATIFTSLQMQYISSKWMGTSANEEILVIEGLNTPMRLKYPEFRDAILKSPYVKDIAAIMEVPPSPIKDAFAFDCDSPVKIEDSHMYVGPVSDNFFEFYQRPIIAGTDFPDYIDGQKFENYILNESAVQMLGWNNPGEAIGKSFKVRFEFGDIFYGGKICGVVEDFHQTSLHHQIEPTVYFQQPLFFMAFLIKINTQNKSGALSFLETTWDEHFPEYPFIYQHQENLYENAYARETAQIRLSTIFTILAIIITLTGLIGIVTILSEQRIKEIAIRLVLGASMPQVLYKLSHEILLVFSISIVAAIAVSLLFVEQWLQNFTYAILMANYWWIPVSIALVAFLTISVVVFLTVYNTARTSPIKSLMSE